MGKRMLSLLLVLALLVCFLPTAALADFTDVQGHWGKNAIIKWSQTGILQGHNGFFRPDDPITRGEAAVIMDRIMQYRTKSENVFLDLGESFFTEPILKTTAAGIIKGHENLVRPYSNMTREEAVVVLGRALGLTQTAKASILFSDSSDISSWAVGYVNEMAKRGYVLGHNGRFNPQSSITRAEIVTILDKSIDVIFSEAKTYSLNIPGTAIINKSNIVLKNMTIQGNLIISEGVGDGDVTLENVKILGKTIIRGGGANSIHITGNSNIANIIIEKNDSGEVRVTTSDGAVVEAVYVEDGRDDVILTGNFENVTVAADVSVRAVGATIDSMEIAAAGAGLHVEAGATVNTLIVNSQAAVENRGSIGSASVNANGVTIDGNKPTTVTVSPDVNQPPTDSAGNTIGGSPPAGGGGFGGGFPSPPPSEVVVGIVGFQAASGNGNEGKFSLLGSGSGKSYTVTVTTTDRLLSFDSATPAQGSGKWIGVVINTDKETGTLQYKTSGSFANLTNADALEAQAAGATGSQSVVYWLKAEEMASGKTIYLKAQGQADSSAVAILVHLSLMDYAGTQAAQPALVTKTDTAVRIDTTPVLGETLEFAKNTADEAPQSGWQDAGQFSGLTPDTSYYFFARVKEAPEYHKAGSTSPSLAVTTPEHPVVTGMLLDSTVGSGFGINSAIFKIAVNGEIEQFSTSVVASADRDKLFIFADGSSIPGDIKNGTLVEFALSSDDKIVVDHNGHALKSLVAHSSPIFFDASQSSNIGYVADLDDDFLTVTDAQVVGGAASCETAFAIAGDVKVYEMYSDNISAGRVAGKDTIRVITTAGQPRTKIVFVNDLMTNQVTEIYIINFPAERVGMYGMLLDNGSVTSAGGDQAYANFKIATDGNIVTYSTAPVPYTDALNLLTFAAGSSIPGAVTKGILVEFSLTGDNKIITDGGSNALKSLIAHNSPLSVAPMQNPNLGYVEEFDSGFLVVTDAKYVGDTAENQAMFSVADDVKVYEMDANDIGACSISATGAVQVIHESGQPRTKILCVYDTVIHKVAEIYVVKDTTHKITGMLKASAVGSGFDSNKAFFTIFTGGVNRAFSTTAVAPADLDKLFEFALGGGVTGDIVNGALVEFTINSDDKIIVDGDGHALKGLVKYDSPISFGTAQAGNLGFVSGYGSGLLTVTDAEIVGGTATSEDDFSLADDVNIYLYDVDKNLLDLGTAPEVVTELGAARAKVLFLYDTDGHKATDIFVIRPEILIGMVLDAGTIVSVGDGQVYADFKLAMGGEVRIISTTSAPYTDATDLLTFASGSAIPGVVTPGMLVQFHVDSVGKIMLDSDCHALKGLLKHDSPVSFGLTQTANLGYVADFSGNLLAVTAEKTVSTPPTVTVFKVADDVKVYEVDDDDIGGTTVSATGAVQVIKVAGADRTKIAFVYDLSNPDEAMQKITEIYVIKTTPRKMTGMLIDSATGSGFEGTTALYKIAVNGEVKIFSTTSVAPEKLDKLFEFADDGAITGDITDGALVEFTVYSGGKVIVDGGGHALKGLLKHDSPVSFGLTQTANLGYVADFSGNLLAVTAEKTVSTPPTVTVFKVADDVKVYEVDDDDIGGTTVSATGAVQVIKVAGADRTKIAFVYDRSDPDDALWKITEIYVIR